MSIPKAVLYFSSASVWSAVVLLTLEEKGYSNEEIDRKEVNLSKGENFNPTFLRLNPNATVPTLVVPLQSTLTNDTESRYKAITETKAIVEFLDRSRSSMSRTRTTSSAPAPTLTPATIAFTTTSTTIIDDILHSKAADPNILQYVNARNESALEILARRVLPSLTEKGRTLETLLSDAQNEKIRVSEKVKFLWRNKEAEIKEMLEVFQNAHKTNDQLEEGMLAKRANFFKVARDSWERVLKEILTRLNEEITGPYVLGDQLSIADLHLAAWMARVVSLVGGAANDDGNMAMGKLEEHVESGFSLPKEVSVLGTRTQRDELGLGHRSKLAIFWDTMKERPSWKKVYGDGLY